MTVSGCHPIRAPQRHHRFRAVLLLLVGAWLGVAPADNAPALESKVKAAYLLNFARFVEWPGAAHQDNQSDLVLGVVDDPAFAATLAQIVANQTAQGRKLTVRHYDHLAGIESCHILYLSRAATTRTENIFTQLQNRPVLTVGDSEDFIRTGGMIGFVIVKSAVRFDINTANTSAVGLSLSSKLLAVARNVIKNP